MKNNVCTWKKFHYLHISGIAGEVFARDASMARDSASKRHGWSGIDRRRNLVVRAL